MRVLLSVLDCGHDERLVRLVQHGQHADLLGCWVKVFLGEGHCCLLEVSVSVEGLECDGAGEGLLNEVLGGS